MVVLITIILHLICDITAGSSIPYTPSIETCTDLKLFCGYGQEIV